MPILDPLLAFDAARLFEFSTYDATLLPFLLEPAFVGSQFIHANLFRDIA